MPDRATELRKLIAYWEERLHRTTDPEDLAYIRERQDARKAELVKFLSLSKAQRDKVEAHFKQIRREEAEQEAYASAEEKAEEEPEQFNPFDPLGIFKRR